MCLLRGTNWIFKYNSGPFKCFGGAQNPRCTARFSCSPRQHKLQNFRQNSYPNVIENLSDATLQIQTLSPKAQVPSSVAHSKLSVLNTLFSLPNAPPCSQSTFKDKRELPVNFQSREYFVSPLPNNNNNNILGNYEVKEIQKQPYWALHTYFGKY